MASKLLNDEFQKHICLDFECTTIEEAIRKAGDLLVVSNHRTLTE